MNKANTIRVFLLLSSWLTLFAYPKHSLKKFFPVTSLTSLLVIGMCTLAWPFNWWRSEGGKWTKLVNDGSFIFGPFFAGTLWIFHVTYGSVKWFIVINTMMDWLFAYPLNALFQKLKLYRLIHFSSLKIFCTFMLFSFLIYPLQIVVENRKRSRI
ncbi:hypothetical protein Q75_04885 [Bacillus coahuilensis p1.1.43]|uniref:Permease n=1 Tax=Bacillus coahuilensis p1.1.43 TaxID=1150625 RepID=A0A147KAC0_9BACI|nr:hypothetical protein [Bacillus coahuilensis]KUP07570.1 hypothetical protein Q75_04885 [Bacillus coahuilensis p1.1.43]